MIGRAPGDLIARTFKRHELAMRLMTHGARTQTISDLTGLTRHQLTTLRRRWMIPPDMRHRGPAPTSFAMFLRSPRTRSEGAALAVLCRVLGAVPARRMANVAREFPSVETGERLCDVFEAHHACFPMSKTEFDQIVLLAMGLAQGDMVALSHCVGCNAAILLDRLGTHSRLCSHCASTAAQASRGDSDLGGSNKPDGVQTSLF